jgi:hypothetical protein
MQSKILGVAVVFVALAGLVSATVVAKLELGDLVERSDRIAEGRVASTETFRNARGTICTRVTIEVSRGFRGAAAGEIFSFAVPGGELGKLGLMIPGMPQFKEGEELLLFLTPETETGVRVPTGLGQGKFGIETDPKTKIKKLARSVGDVDLRDAKTGKAAPAPAREIFEYADFTATIETKIKEDDARKAKKTAPAKEKK